MFLLGASPEIIYNKERIHVKQKAKEEHMKKLSVIAIISSVTTYILALFFYVIEHSGADISLSYI